MFRIHAVTDCRVIFVKNAVVGHRFSAVVLRAVRRRILGPTYPRAEPHRPAPQAARMARGLRRPARVLRCLARRSRGRRRSAHVVYAVRGE